MKSMWGGRVEVRGVCEVRRSRVRRKEVKGVRVRSGEVVRW